MLFQAEIRSLWRLPVYHEGAYYLPVYFQVLGDSATMAGVRCVARVQFIETGLTPRSVIPFSLGASLTAVTGGIIISKTGTYRALIVISFAVMTLGFGLMIMLDDKSSV